VWEGAGGFVWVGKSDNFVPRGPNGLCHTARRYADSQTLCDKKADSLAAWNDGRNQAGTGGESRDGVAQRECDQMIDVASLSSLCFGKAGTAG
jgi:hypothetical protein